MEAELQKDFPAAKIELIKGGGGIFDVHADGELIYSKQKSSCGGFPVAGEVSALLEKRAS